MDLSLLSLSIGIGLVVSLLFSEVFGLAAGGLVVPGYFALYLTQPLDVLLTLLAALATFVVVRVASSFVIIYGRRRTAFMILIGYAVGMAVNALAGGGVEMRPDELNGALAEGVHPGTEAATLRQPAFVELASIGYIIPGLIAIWLDRQGVIATLAALLTSAVVVRLLLILLVPEDLHWFDATSPSVLPYWMDGVAR